MDDRLTVREGLNVTNAEGATTLNIDLTLGEMKIKDVLLREKARLEEVLAAVDAQLESLG